MLDDLIFNAFGGDLNWGGKPLQDLDPKFQGWIMTQILVGMHRVNGWQGMEQIGSGHLRSVLADCQKEAGDLLDRMIPPDSESTPQQKFDALHRLRNAIIEFAHQRMQRCVSEQASSGTCETP